MAATVSLHGVVEELESLTEGSAAFLNRETGEIYSIRGEEADMVEDGVASGDVPEWLEDELPKIREVLESEVWLSLPTRFDIHEWSIMDGFALSIEDPGLRDELLTAIRGRGAFRCFKDIVHRHGIHEDWYRHKTVSIGRIAADWLDENEVTYVDDLSAT